jgi:hypothetical protein
MAAADGERVCPAGYTGRVCDLHFDVAEDDDVYSYDDGDDSFYVDDDTSTAETFLRNSYGFARSHIKSLCHIEVMGELDCARCSRAVFDRAGAWCVVFADDILARILPSIHSAVCVCVCVTEFMVKPTAQRE